MQILKKQAKTEVKDKKIEGYAFLWGKDEDGDIITRQSVERTLKSKKATVFRYLHGYDLPVGKVAEWKPDDTGLAYSVELIDTPRAQEIYEIVRKGVINNVSIGARTFGAVVEENGTRIHTDIEIYEISLTEHPAREGTSAIAKSDLLEIAEIFSKWGKL